MSDFRWVPKDGLDTMDFYDEYFEWIMEKHPGPKDYLIAKFEDADDFDEFIESRHPELMVREYTQEAEDRHNDPRRR